MFNGPNRVCYLLTNLFKSYGYFIQKLKKKIKNENLDLFDEKIEKFVNLTIAKITNNLEKFNYNVIIANMYETYNFLNNYLKENENIKNLEDNYIKILICFSPVIPHFANECLSELQIKGKIQWPLYDENILKTQHIDIVVQINGKKRALLNTNKGISQTDLLELIKKDRITKKYLNNIHIKKIIFVKDRLINILINE